MKHLIVSAAASGLGKTLLCCELISRASSQGMRVLCCKLSRGGHAPPGVQEGPGREGTDTWRYCRAGAARAVVAGFQDPAELGSLVREIPGNEDLVIWESNTVASYTALEADCLVYIRSDAVSSPKDPRLAEKADFVLEGPLDSSSARCAAIEIMRAPMFRKFHGEGMEANRCPAFRNTTE